VVAHTSIDIITLSNVLLTLGLADILGGDRQLDAIGQVELVRKKLTEICEGQVSIDLS